MRQQRDQGTEAEDREHQQPGQPGLVDGEQVRQIIRGKGEALQGDIERQERNPQITAIAAPGDEQDEVFQPEHQTRAQGQEGDQRAPVERALQRLSGTDQHRLRRGAQQADVIRRLDQQLVAVGVGWQRNDDFPVGCAARPGLGVWLAGLTKPFAIDPHPVGAARAGQEDRQR
jgi:hypothetical protein